MAEVLSKNLFDLLGDDDSVATVKPAAPKKDEKKPASSAQQQKKDVAKKPERAPRNEYRPRGGFAGKQVEGRQPRNNNRDADLPEGQREDRRPRGDRGPRAPRGRGGFRGREFDRHSGSVKSDSLKKEQAGSHSWGNPVTAEEEAKKDSDVVATETPEGETPAAETEEVKEPEEVLKTLEQYFAEKAKPSVEVAIRKANEGVDDSKWKDAVPLKKEEDEIYFGELAKEKKAAKAKKEREAKSFVPIDQRFADEQRSGFGTRGGRGGRGRDNNSTRRGGNNGGRRGNNKADGAVNVGDESHFPSLGGK